MSAVLNLDDVREMLVSAQSIENTYGPNAYSDYLRKHHTYPDAAAASAIGQSWGGRCRANDGKLYP